MNGREQWANFIDKRWRLTPAAEGQCVSCDTAIDKVYTVDTVYSRYQIECSPSLERNILQQLAE